jgi:hypothetical protein
MDMHMMGRIRRWTIRILSLLLIGLFLLIFVGETASEGLPNAASLSSTEKGLFVALFIMIIGLVLCWKYYVLGPIVTLAGYILFCIIEGELMKGPFLMFPVVGLLFFIDGIIIQKGKQT